MAIIQFYLFIFSYFQLIQCDLLRTVYCASKCNNYLKVPETRIPLCQNEHLQLNQCGTVISCSWSDVEVEKNRRLANSSEEVICCYSVQLKEKGDCDFQQLLPTTSGVQVENHHSATTCPVQTPALFSLIVLLIFAILVQSTYILWSCTYQKRKSLQKLSDNADIRHQPIYTTRPICETRLLSVEEI